MRYRILLSWAAVCGFGWGEMAWSQSVPETKPPLVDPKAVTTAAEDAAKRLQIIMSPTWKEVQELYGQWMKQQVIYTPAQLKQLNDKIQFEVRTLPADELQEFIDDWLAKLKIVRSADSVEAKEWLGVYLTNMTDGYRRRYLQKMGITNPAQLSARELEAAISRVRADHTSVQQYQAGFDRSREAAVAATQAAVTATETARLETRAPATSSSSTAASPYMPTKPTWEPPKTNFSISNDGTVSFYYSF